MAVDEQPSHPCRRWSMPLESGNWHRLTPRADEPIYVTDVFLVDADSAGGQGVVAACVEIGKRDVLLGLLSAEDPHGELHAPLLLDEEFRFYVMGPGDDANADADTDTDTQDDADADAVVVMFEGFLVTWRSNTEEEEAADEKDEDIEKYVEDEYEEYEEREETYGELDRYVARASSAGGISKDAQQVVAISVAFLGILVSVSVLAFLGS